MAVDRKKGWTFLHVNDSHMGTPRSYRFRPAINRRWAAILRQMSGIDAEFLLHGGDLTRDGETHEFEYQQAREDLEKLPFPTFVIPGNMDVGNKHATRNGAKPKWSELGLDWNDPDCNMTSRSLDFFSSYFGPVHWTFLYRGVRFTGFFAAMAGSSLPQEEHLLADARADPEPTACSTARGHDALLAFHGAARRARLGPYRPGSLRQLVFFHWPAAPPKIMGAASG